MLLSLKYISFNWGASFNDSTLLLIMNEEISDEDLTFVACYYQSSREIKLNCYWIEIEIWNDTSKGLNI